MGFFDNLLGRSLPVQPDLDRLFGLPSAAVTLQAALDYVPTGIGSVAFRAPKGRAFADVEQEIRALLDADGGPAVTSSNDSFGYTWLVVQHDPLDIAGLVTDLHAINATLKDNGFGSTLLCSLLVFEGPRGQRLGIVYLFKQGRFYPFAPTALGRSATTDAGAPSQRDNMVELQVRDLLAEELPIEPDLGRWFAVWGAPGLG